MALRPPSDSRWYASVAVLVLGAFFAGMGAAPTAIAQEPRVAVCKADFQGGMTPERGRASIESWMTEQLAAGRTQFLTQPIGGAINICAW